MKRSFKETFFDIHQFIFYQHWACRHTLTFTDVFSDFASALNVRIRSSRSSSSSNNNWKIDILDIVRAARWWCSYTGQTFYQQVRTANKKWPLVFIWYFTTANIFQTTFEQQKVPGNLSLEECFRHSDLLLLVLAIKSIFFSSIIFFCFFSTNININYFANSSLCVKFQSLCFISKPTVHELQFTSMRPRMNINRIDIHPLNQQSKENI